MSKELDLNFEYSAYPEYEKNNKIKDFAKKYFYSYWFLLVSGIAVIIGWATNISDISFAFLGLNITLCLILLDDVSPIMGLLFMFPLALPKNASFETVIYLVIYVIPIAFAAVYHIVKFKAVKRVGKWAKPQLFVAIALIMGGLGSNLTPERYVGGLTQGLGLGLGSLAVYLLVLNYCKPPQGVDYKLYIAKMFGAVSLLHATMVFLLVFVNPWGIPFSEINHSMVDVGGVKSNALSHMMLMTVPFLLYHAIKQPKTMIIHLLLSFFVCFCSIFTYSRGCMLMLFILGPIMYITAFCMNKKTKGRMAMIYSVVLLVIIIFAIVFRDKLVEGINSIIHMRDNSSLDSFSSGRVTLYREARLLFQSYPLFGTGLGYISPSIYNYDSTVLFLWFHSTFWQVLACTGIVGFIAYAFSYYARFKMVFKNIKHSLFSLFMLFSFLFFEIYSLIDANSFLPLPFMFFIGVETAFMEMVNENKEKELDKKEYEKYSYICN